MTSSQKKQRLLWRIGWVRRRFELFSNHSERPEKFCSPAITGYSWFNDKKKTLETFSFWKKPTHTYTHTFLNVMQTTASGHRHTEHWPVCFAAHIQQPVHDWTRCYMALVSASIDHVGSLPLSPFLHLSPSLCLSLFLLSLILSYLRVCVSLYEPTQCSLWNVFWFQFWFQGISGFTAQSQEQYKIMYNLVTIGIVQTVCETGGLFPGSCEFSSRSLQKMLHLQWKTYIRGEDFSFTSFSVFVCLFRFQCRPQFLSMAEQSSWHKGVFIWYWNSLLHQTNDQHSSENVSRETQSDFGRLKENLTRIYQDVSPCQVWPDIDWWRPHWLCSHEWLYEFLQDGWFYKNVEFGVCGWLAFALRGLCSSHWTDEEGCLWTCGTNVDGCYQHRKGSHHQTVQIHQPKKGIHHWKIPRSLMNRRWRCGLRDILWMQKKRKKNNDRYVRLSNIVSCAGVSWGTTTTYEDKTCTVYKGSVTQIWRKSVSELSRWGSTPPCSKYCSVLGPKSGKMCICWFHRNR